MKTIFQISGTCYTWTRFKCESTAYVRFPLIAKENQEGKLHLQVEGSRFWRVCSVNRKNPHLGCWGHAGVLTIVPWDDSSDAFLSSFRVYYTCLSISTQKQRALCALCISFSFCFLPFSAFLRGIQPPLVYLKVCSPPPAQGRRPAWCMSVYIQAANLENRIAQFICSSFSRTNILPHSMTDVQIVTEILCVSFLITYCVLDGRNLWLRESKKTECIAVLKKRENTSCRVFEICIIYIFDILT